MVINEKISTIQLVMDSALIINTTNKNALVKYVGMRYNDHKGKYHIFYDVV